RPPTLRFCRGVNGFTHLLEGAAPADVGDGIVDVLVGGLRLARQQFGDRHDHARLTIAALRDFVVDPSLLHLVQRAVLGEALDGDDLLADRGARRQRAGTRGDTVDVDRAGAALRYAAAVFRSGQSDVFADGPKQRR